MANELLQKLEDKIDNAVETIELLRLQHEELEEKYANLLEANNALKSKQAAWEQNLAAMLEKLDAIEPRSSNHRTSSVESEVTEDYAV